MTAGMSDIVQWLLADEVRALALTLYGEARGEPVEGRIAVASADFSVMTAMWVLLGLGTVVW